jgi:hypothetical protein
MKKYILCILLFVSLPVCAQTSIYDLSFITPDSTTIALQTYAGHKICFVIAPLTDDSMLQQLKAQVDTSFIMIGIVSTPTDSLQALYEGSGIILTAPMNIYKGDGQSPLMQWLTDYTKNGLFNEDATGVGQRFFVSENGRLYALLSKETPVNDPVVQQVLSTQVPAQDQPPVSNQAPNNNQVQP